MSATVVVTSVKMSDLLTKIYCSEAFLLRVIGFKLLLRYFLLKFNTLQWSTSVELSIALFFSRIYCCFHLKVDNEWIILQIDSNSMSVYTQWVSSNLKVAISHVCIGSNICILYLLFADNNIQNEVHELPKKKYN